MDRKPIFDTVRSLLGRGFSHDEVATLDRAIDAALGRADDPPASPSAAPARRLGAAGEALIRRWEGCARRRGDGMIEAYPDPGSADGHPWTIGWGATGPDIGPGTISQGQCDARLEADLARFVREVDQAIGNAATTASQFDALVSFHYNTGAIFRATLTRKHKAGDYPGAAAEFGKWIHNAGKPLKGLRNRRTEEAALYASD